MTNITTRPFCELFAGKKGGLVALRNFYRVYLGTRQGQQIWIVDGAKTVRELYPPFVMGGNDQRYRFNPVNDVWIDNRIGGIELEYTIGHELIERKLMREKGMSYDKAHLEGLALEKKMRANDARKVARLRKIVDPRIAPVYRAFYKTIEGIQVWFIDGPKVRETLEQDFCFMGSDIEYDFIPDKQIWLDATMSCEHVHFALVQALERRKLLAAGIDEPSYERALLRQVEEYAVQDRLVAEHEARLAKVHHGVREKGAKQR